MKIGDKIALKGRSKHGKNRIQQFGNEFWISEIRDWSLTTKHQHLKGPFAMVFSPTGDHRWIAIENDPDFEIIKKSA